MEQERGDLFAPAEFGQSSMSSMNMAVMSFEKVSERREGSLEPVIEYPAVASCRRKKHA
jgi:hypothetical protein